MARTGDRTSRRAAPARRDRRQALIDAAIGLLSEKAYDDVSAADLAQRAGVAHGLLFYYFDDKRGLVVESLRQVFAQVVEFQQPRPSETTERARLEGFVGRHFEFLGRYGTGYLTLLESLSAHPEIRELFQETRQEAQRMVARIIGVPEPLTPMARAAFGAWIAYLDSLSEELLTSTDLTADDLTTLAVDVLLDSTVRAGLRT